LVSGTVLVCVIERHLDGGEFVRQSADCPRSANIWKVIGVGLYFPSDLIDFTGGHVREGRLSAYDMFCPRFDVTIDSSRHGKY
jgi:hypothetical protein